MAGRSGSSYLPSPELCAEHAADPAEAGGGERRSRRSSPRRFVGPDHVENSSRGNHNQFVDSDFAAWMTARKTGTSATSPPGAPTTLRKNEVAGGSSSSTAKLGATATTSTAAAEVGAPVVPRVLGTARSPVSMLSSFSPSPALGAGGGQAQGGTLRTTSGPRGPAGRGATASAALYLSGGAAEDRFADMAADHERKLLQASLQSTQQRVARGENELEAQQRANEELLKTLDTTQMGNRKVHEQLEVQERQIASLTAELVRREQEVAVEKARHAEMVHDLKQTGVEESRRLETKLELQRDIFDEDKRCWKRAMRTKVEMFYGQFRAFRSEYFEVRNGIRASLEAFQEETMAKVKREIGKKVAVVVTKMREKRDALERRSRELAGLLEDERTARKNEVAVWGRRTAAIQAEMDEVKITCSREQHAGAAALSSTERQMRQEREAMQKRLLEYEGVIDEGVRFKTEAEEVIRSTKQQLAALAEEHGQLLHASAAKSGTVDSLGRALRDNEAALHTAKTNADLLREQLDDVKKNFQGTFDFELEKVQRSYEDKIRLFAESSFTISTDMKRNVVLMQDELSRLKAENEALKYDKKVADSEALDLYDERRKYHERLEFLVSENGKIEEKLGEMRACLVEREVELEGVANTAKEKDFDLLKLENDRKETELLARTSQHKMVEKVHALSSNLSQMEADYRSYLQKSILSEEWLTKELEKERTEKQVSDSKLRTVEVERAELGQKAKLLEEGLSYEREQVEKLRREYENWREGHQVQFREMREKYEAALAKKQDDNAALRRRVGELTESTQQLVVAGKTANDAELQKYCDRARKNTQFVAQKQEQDAADFAYLQKRYQNDVTELKYQLERSERRELDLVRELEAAKARFAREARAREAAGKLEAERSVKADLEKVVKSTKAEFAKELEAAEKAWAEKLFLEKKKSCEMRERLEEALEREREKVELLTRPGGNEVK